MGGMSRCYRVPFERTAVSNANLVLPFGDLGFHEAQFLVRDLTAGVSFIENIERVLSRQLAKSSVRTVGIAPVADARKQEKYNPKPKKPTPTEIPVIPIRVRHLSLLN
jgi:hypothetical protein